MKYFADKKRTELEFKVHDWVLVRLQPYRQHSVELRKYQKLALLYFGPFQITERIGPVAYRLALPDYAKIHPVFHISQLKKFHGPESTQVFLPLPLHSLPEGPICTPDRILDSRWVQHDNEWQQQFLVHWDSSPHDTWEFKKDLQRLYPTLNLEDKVPSDGVGIVMSPDMEPKESSRSDLIKDQPKGPVRKSLRIKKKSWKLRDLEEA